MTQTQLCELTARMLEQCATGCGAIHLDTMRRCTSACQHAIHIK